MHTAVLVVAVTAQPETSDVLSVVQEDVDPEAQDTTTSVTVVVAQEVVPVVAPAVVESVTSQPFPKSQG